MSGKLVLLQTDGTVATFDIPTKEPELSVLQKLIGGWIERVTVFWEGRICDAYVDEEGKLKNLPFNDMASTARVNAHGDSVDVIVGRMAIWLPERAARRRPAGGASKVPATSAKAAK